MSGRPKVVLLPLPGGKKGPPLTKGWAEPRYDPVDLPDGSNVGLWLEGLVVVDCDSSDTVALWEAVGPETPLQVRTSRGKHYFYKAAPDAKWPKTPFPKIDIKAGIGAYVVIPPSLHPGGDQYQWDGEWREQTDPLRKLRWLPELRPEQLDPLGGTDNGTERATPDVATWDHIPEGVRHNTLVSIGGSLRKQGASEDGMARALTAMNSELCSPPIDADEVMGIARSLARYEPEPWQEFQLVPETGERGPTGFQADELMTMELPEIQWAVPGLLPEGLTILAGKPKIGKSWLSLGLAVAVAEGGEYFGQPVEQGDVLYLALEDNPRRLKKRLGKLLGGRPAPSLLRFETFSLRFPEGLALIREWLGAVERPKLIIVDTFAKVRAPGSSRSEQIYRDDYEAVAPLKAISDSGVPIVVVHHQRKDAAEDIIDTISGSTGLTGAADAALVLKKDRLQGRGRDIEGDIDWKVEFDAAAVVWRRIGGEIVMVDDRSIPDRLAADLAPGEPVGSREDVAKRYDLSKNQAASVMRQLRSDPRFEAASSRKPIYRSTAEST
jgi:hypothetical protein